MHLKSLIFRILVRIVRGRTNSNCLGLFNAGQWVHEQKNSRIIPYRSNRTMRIRRIPEWNPLKAIGRLWQCSRRWPLINQNGRKASIRMKFVFLFYILFSFFSIPAVRCEYPESLQSAVAIEKETKKKLFGKYHLHFLGF